MKRLEERLSALELRFVPPEPWTITARYSDGRVEQIDAETYKRIKLDDPGNVFVIDRRITNNLRELKNWLDMVYELAAVNPNEEMEI